MQRDAYGCEDHAELPGRYKNREARKVQIMTTRALVTGAAGFIGSHLAERLIDEGFEVIGIDSFEDYYPRWMKEANLENPRHSPKFTLVEGNLLSDSLFGSAKTASNLKNIDYVFHEAAQAGVRSSWKQFQGYVNNNILATQRLLEFIKGSGIRKFIYASSSSVYGNADSLPIKEDSPTSPLSPYGATKLAAENLCHLYCQNFDVPVVSLRYFTVYGPRQRPDMGLHKFITAMLNDEEVEIFGDGKQTRDFTFVSDIVEATLLAAGAPTGEVLNIGGGTRIALIDAVALIESLTGKKAGIKWMNAQKGDVQDTWADIERARECLGYEPKVSFEQGLRAEISWIEKVHRGDASHL